MAEIELKEYEVAIKRPDNYDDVNEFSSGEVFDLEKEGEKNAQKEKGRKIEEKKGNLKGAS